ncbi:Calx-beta domain-containing protein [Paludisphaera borealis]|uniref:Calx-beta domain-containing protein n=1 Tax=Paludisphaera borealis TaxID=1387353 RepID=A0A1U7CRF4_9BACT|nr:Calx-beta domain-containing protein [Paludisphaera borealis]APW61476.1 hypothetical protein BSF38_02991 [Paludisphaera borealis]
MAKPWLISCARERLAGRRRRSRTVISLEGLERRELLTVDVSVVGHVVAWPASNSDGVVNGQWITYELDITNTDQVNGEPVVLTDVLDPRVSFTTVNSIHLSKGVDFTYTHDPATGVVTITIPAVRGKVDVEVEAETTFTAADVPGVPRTNSFSITTADVNTSTKTSGSMQSGGPTPIADVALASVTASAPDGWSPHPGGKVVYSFVAVNNSTTTKASFAEIFIYNLKGGVGFNSDNNPGWTDAEPAESASPGAMSDLQFVIGDLAPGASRTVTLVLDARPATSPSPVITFRASAMSYAYDLDPSNNVVDVSTPVPVSAETKVVVVADSHTTPVGDDLSYTVQVAHQGSDAATGFVVSQTLPAGTTFVSATWGGASIAGSVVGGVLSIPLPNLAGPLVVTLNTSGVQNAPTTLSAPIKVTWNELPEGTGGVYTLGTVTPAGTLSIRLDADKSDSYVNQMLTYSYTATNTTATDAHDVVVALAFPPSSQMFVPPGDYTVTATATGQVVTFHLGDLPSGASRTLSVEAVPLLPALGGVVHVVGTITEADRPASDYPALSVDRSVLPWVDVVVHVLPSDPGVFLFIVTNNGPVTATGVEVYADTKTFADYGQIDGVPVYFQGTGPSIPFYPGGGISGLPVYPPYTIPLGSLAPGASRVIQMVGATRDRSSASVTTIEPNLSLGDQSLGPSPDPGVLPLNVVARLTTDGSQVVTGGYATFTALAINVGRYPGRGVTIAAAIPANSRLVSASPGVVVQGNLLLFTVDSLPVGATGGFQFVVSPTWDALSGGLTSNAGVLKAAQPIVTLAANAATATVAVVAGPSGSPVLGATSYAVDANAGSVAITINRVGGVSGPLTIDYATVAGSAWAGRDFTPTWGTLAFADGETSKTIAVPIAADPYGSGDRSFLFYIGTGASAVVTIHEAVPPTVASVQWRGAAIDVRFARPVAVSTALASANFALVTPGRDQKFGTRDDRRIGLTVWYDPTTLTSKLMPRRRLPANGMYRLTVSGAGVRGATGVLLAGDGVHSGTDYTTELVWRRPSIARRASPAGGR